MAELRIRVSEGEGAVTLWLQGEIGVSQVASLERELLRLSARRPPLTIFEMGELGFISSLAMGALLAYQRGVSHHGGQVCLRHVQPPVQDALRHARLDTVLRIEPDPSAPPAVAAPQGADRGRPGAP